MIINLGTNSIYNSSTATTPIDMIAQLTTFIIGIRANCSNVDFLIEIPPKANESMHPVCISSYKYSDYATALINFCRSNSHGMIRHDLSALSYDTSLYADGVHPNSDGQFTFAQTICDSLNINFDQYIKKTELSLNAGGEYPEFYKHLVNYLALKQGWSIPISISNSSLSANRCNFSSKCGYAVSDAPDNSHTWIFLDIANSGIGGGILAFPADENNPAYSSGIIYYKLFDSSGNGAWKIFQSEDNLTSVFSISGNYVLPAMRSNQSKILSISNSSTTTDYTIAVPTVSGQTYAYSGFLKNSSGVSSAIFGQLGSGGALTVQHYGLLYITITRTS